jgi:hypothetical protein
LVEQILSISLAAASVDASQARVLVKEAALKTATTQLLKLHTELPLDEFTELGMAVLSEPENAGELVRSAAVSYLQSHSGAVEALLTATAADSALASALSAILARSGMVALEEAALNGVVLTPELLEQTRQRIPEKYRAQLENVGFLAQTIAESPQTATTLLKVALKRAAAEAARRVLDNPHLKVDSAVIEDVIEAGKGVRESVAEEEKENVEAAVRLGLTGPAELELTMWGKVTRGCLGCVPWCRSVTKRKNGVKGRGGEVLEMVGEVAEYMAEKTLLQFLYFDMRSELLEASRGLEAINKQMNPGMLSVYKKYTREQLGEDLGYFVVERIRRVMGEYEERKKEEGETDEAVKILESMGIIKEMRKILHALDVYVNEAENDLLVHWPETFVIAKKKIDHLADMMEQLMEEDVEGDCVFDCCGGLWVKQKKTGDVQLKKAVEEGLGKAATKEQKKQV